MHKFFSNFSGGTLKIGFFLLVVDAFVAYMTLKHFNEMEPGMGALAAIVEFGILILAIKFVVVGLVTSFLAWCSRD